MESPSDIDPAEAMLNESEALLCVEPTADQQSLVKRIADRHGLDFLSCSGEAAALKCLESSRRYAAMVIGHELEDGNSFQVMAAARLSLRHATLPIAFVMGDRNLRVAQNALNVGATEIFLRSEQESLMAFIGDWAAAGEQPDVGGRVLLVEDVDLQACYVEHLCNALGMAVDRARDVDSAERLFKANEYQIVIVDVVLDDTKSGITFVKSIRQNHGLRQPILVMSGFEDLPRRLLALRSGADDFIGKPFASEEFIWRVKKILQAYARQDFGDEEQAAAAKRNPASDLLAMLSPREREICGRILAGTSDKDIAKELGISFWTVRSHVQQIFNKTGVLNRLELMARFIPKQANG